MRRVQVDFVEPKAWKFIWAAAGVVLTGIAVITGIQVWQLHHQRTTLQTEIAAAQTLQRLAQQKNAESTQANPRAMSEAAASQLLERDWNVLYDMLENPELSSVRLLQMSFDATTGAAMLEYELDTMEKAASVASALNAMPSRTGIWRLERLETGGAPSSIGGASTKVRGVWRGQIAP